MVGSKLVFPGPKMGDGETLYKLMEGEAVSISLGVPTVWLALLGYAEAAGQKLNALQRTLIGGAAVPESMIRAFRDKHDVDVIQGWGMTENESAGYREYPESRHRKSRRRRNGHAQGESGPRDIWRRDADCR